MVKKDEIEVHNANRTQYLWPNRNTIKNSNYKDWEFWWRLIHIMNT